MKKLPLTDSAWLTMESDTTPMHVGSLQSVSYTHLTLPTIYSV